MLVARSSLQAVLQATDADTSPHIFGARNFPGIESDESGDEGGDKALEYAQA